MYGNRVYFVTTFLTTTAPFLCRVSRIFPRHLLLFVQVLHSPAPRSNVSKTTESHLIFVVYRIDVHVLEYLVVPFIYPVSNMTELSPHRSAGQVG